MKYMCVFGNCFAVSIVQRVSCFKLFSKITIKVKHNTTFVPSVVIKGEFRNSSVSRDHASAFFMSEWIISFSYILDKQEKQILISRRLNPKRLLQTSDVPKEQVGVWAS